MPTYSLLTPTQYPTGLHSSNLIGKKFLSHNASFVCASVGACVGLQVPVHVQRSKEGIGSLSVGVTGVCRIPILLCGCWNLDKFLNDHTASALNHQVLSSASSITCHVFFLTELLCISGWTFNKPFWHMTASQEKYYRAK